jgi:hypothetical protein
MTWRVLLLALIAANAQEDTEGVVDEVVEEQNSDGSMQQQEQNVKDLKSCIEGLEFFLQDKKDYEKYCPKEEWTQPSLGEYKEDPKSHLPEGCKPEEPAVLEE